MSSLYDILANSIPLLLASFGALVSEHAGCMALFLDGVINAGAFLCFTFTVLFHSAAAGTICAALVLLICIMGIAGLVEKVHANHFLSALALNSISTGLISILSTRLYATRGVLTSPAFLFEAAPMRLTTTLAALLLFCAGWIFLRFSKAGLYLRITGSNENVLKAHGLNPARLRMMSWGIAAVFGGTAGCIMALRLSSFVPNIASGNGWTALAAVFLGKKNTAAVFAAVLVFAAAQYGANNLQNIPGLQALPPSLLLALPYLTALVLIFAAPRKRCQP